MTYAVFEQRNPTAPKRRAFGDLAFASLDEAVGYFEARGGFADVDADHDAADAFYNGLVFTVERV